MDLSERRANKDPPVSSIKSFFFFGTLYQMPIFQHQRDTTGPKNQ